MNNNINLFFKILIIFALFFYSCKNEKKELVDQKMDDSKGEISNVLDSSEVFFQSIIEELKNNPSNLSEIKKRFQHTSQDFEKKITVRLDDINKLGKEGKITNKEANEWINEIKASKSMADYKTIKHLLDSLEALE